MIESLYKPFQKWSEKGTIWIFSDPHFDDEDLVNVYDDRPSADELVRRINSKVGKCDTLICLGDVGALSYVPFLRDIRFWLWATTMRVELYMKEKYIQRAIPLLNIRRMKRSIR